MSLIKHGDLASWERLERDGIDVVDWPGTGPNGEVLHIGFLNMMPDRALKATERQFLKLVACGAQRNSVCIHPFTIDGLNRQAEASRYVSQAYETFDQMKQRQLDGLILTGANPGNSEITAEEYWPYFEKVTHWADAHVPSVFCSCLASHAILKMVHGIERTRCKPDKRWGVFKHQVIRQQHPLMIDMPSEYDEPRSHVFEMTSNQLEPYGIEILASSPDADFGIATSEDGIKWVFLQGHPEYDTVSLLKEYKREIHRYQMKERTDYPGFPLNYLSESVCRELEIYRDRFLDALQRDLALPLFPEAEILPAIKNSWNAHAQILFRNWLYQVACTKNQEKSI